MRLHLLLPLLTPLTSACLVYSASQSRGLNNLRATLVDNGQQVCRFDGDGPDSGGAYRFTCIAANYAAIVYHESGGRARVTYANPGGNFEFFVLPGGFGGTYTWYAENYGC